MDKTEIKQEQTERTFTQAELNAIVQERVGETKAKYGDYEELKAKAIKYDEQIEAEKSELQKANERADGLQAELDAIRTAQQVRTMREDVATAKGVPASLLTGSTQEECEAQADALVKWAKPSGYPKVPDGGDPLGHAKKTTREQFKEWLDSI